MVRYLIGIAVFFNSLLAGSINQLKPIKRLRIMVIDSGVNVEIPEIKPYLKFYRPEDVIDNEDHGTHVTGIIASRACKGVEIIPCKGWDINADNSFQMSRECLNRAVLLKVDIVNYSMGGYGRDPVEYSFIKRLKANGTLLVAAAGNEGFDLEIRPFYPASYNLSNIRAVGALGPDGLPRKSSNHKPGIEWENGYKVESFNRFGERVKFSGTSMATAIYTSKLVERFCNGK